MKEMILSYTINKLRSGNSQLKDFDFFRFEDFAKNIEHLKVPFRYHFYTFLLVTSGGGSHEIDSQKYELIPGRLFLIAPGQVHAWSKLINVSGFIVLFTDSFMALARGRKLMADWPLFRPGHRCYFDLSEAELNKWVDEFYHIESEFSNADEFTRDSLFYSIGSWLVRISRMIKGVKSVSGVQHSDFLYSFQELIEENFLTMKLPKDYAAKMHVTANYLNTLCKKKSGKSAGELIRQRILLEAKRLLAHTELSVSEIAFKLGFEDNSYFGRYFSKYIGETPARFRLIQQK